MLHYVFLTAQEERFSVLVHINGAFDSVDIDWEDGKPVRLKRAQIATPGIDVRVPGDPRKLHIQLLRANAAGTKGPLLVWLGQKRLLAFLEEDDGSKAQLVTMSDASAFTTPDGGLDEAAVRADADAVLTLAARVQLGFSPGEAE